MLRLAEKDTTDFHTFHKEVVDLLDQAWSKPQGTIDGQIKDPSVGHAAKGTTQKAEHLPSQRLQHDDSSQPRSISEGCSNNWNNHPESRQWSKNLAQ